MTSTLLTYSFLSGATIAILWFFYRLCGLQRLTFLRLNRALLLSVFFLGLILPAAIFIPRQTNDAPGVIIVNSAPIEIDLPLEEFPENVVPAVSNSVSLKTTLANVLPWVFFAGFAVCLLRISVGLINVIVLIFNGKHSKLSSGFTLVINTHANSSFAWGRWIVTNRTDNSADSRMIIAHEQSHLYFHHWIDILLSQI